MTLDANTPIDSPELLAEAKSQLLAEYPEAEEDPQFDTLVNLKAQSIYNKLRGIDGTQTT